MACWSSKGISAWPACRPHKIPASAHKFHYRTLLDNGLAIKAFFVTFRRFLCDMSRPAQFLPFTSFPKLHADKEKRLPLICDSLHIDSHASLCEALFRWPPQARCWAHCQEAGGAHSSKWRNQDRRGTNYSKDSCLATIWPVRSWRQA